MGEHEPGILRDGPGLSRYSSHCRNLRTLRTRFFDGSISQFDGQAVGDLSRFFERDDGAFNRGLMFMRKAISE